MEEMRLQKYIAQEGIASRRKAEDLIRAGKIKVNGKTAVIGQKITPGVDEVELFSQTLRKRDSEPVAYIFNKPKGVTSTTRKFKGEKNVLDYFPGKYRLYPAGRLDKDSRGLMIMTNDGELANQIMHPKFKSEKEYIVTLDRPIDEISLKRLRRGIKYEGVEYKTISVRELDKRKLRIVLGEGKKRHIRMMMRACKYQVRDLFRKRINELVLGDLQAGKYKKLDEEDLANLLAGRRR